MAVKIDVDMPKGCMYCPFRHWIYDTYDESEPYDICGISGEEIPYGISADGPMLKLDNCMLIECE